MKTKAGVFAIVALLGLSGSLVSAEDDPPTKPATKAEKKPAAGTNFTTICYVQKQDCTITAKAGPKGTVYSVRKNDGKMLCENASLEQLRAQAPDLHQFIKSAMATKSGKNGDARLRRVMDARVR
jgi:hypothetical protein